MQICISDTSAYLYPLAAKFSSELLECLKCGHKYYANGTDIWLRKCPKCQGGRP